MGTPNRLLRPKSPVIGSSWNWYLRNVWWYCCALCRWFERWDSVEHRDISREVEILNCSVWCVLNSSWTKNERARAARANEFGTSHEQMVITWKRCIFLPRPTFSIVTHLISALWRFVQKLRKIKLFGPNQEEKNKLFPFFFFGKPSVAPKQVGIGSLRWEIHCAVIQCVQ